MDDRVGRRFVQWIAIGAAGLAGAWAAYLVLAGGIDVRIFGSRISSHEPLRPLLITALALSVFILAGGRFSSRPVRAIARIDAPWLAGGLASLTFVVGFSYATMTAGAVDAYGYVSQADLWLQGTLKVSQPWVADAPWPLKRWAFIPPAYKASEIDPAETYTYVPICAPGLPLLMAGAKFIGGQCALFAVVPLLGGLAVLATYGIGRRLASARVGLVAAGLLATSPIFLFMLMTPMTDVAATGAWAVAFYFLLGRRWSSFATAGAWCSLAILIRPNLAWIAGAMGLLFVIRAWRDRGAWPSHMRHALAFAGGVLPGVFATAAVNQYLFGSPLLTGYGGLENEFAWANILPNLESYGSWFIETQTPLALVGVAALLIPLRWVWPATPDRSVFLIIGLIVVGIWAEYCAYQPFDVWWYLRFLLPCWPFFMIGLAAVLSSVRRPWSWVLVGVVVLGLGGFGLGVAADRGAFRLWKEERRYVSVAELVRTMTDANSAVITAVHSGSLQYYSGRTTVRFDYIDKEWLDRAVQWMTSRGMHVYALLEDSELPHFRAHFSSQRALAVLDRPSLVYNGPATIYLYDLTQPRDLFTRPVTSYETYKDRHRCARPK